MLVGNEKVTPSNVWEHLNGLNNEFNMKLESFGKILNNNIAQKVENQTIHNQKPTKGIEI